MSRKGCGFDSHSGHLASIAQLVEQIPLKDKVGGSIPPGRTLARFNLVKILAVVAELVYALVLGTSVARLEGSSPSHGT